MDTETNIDIEQQLVLLSSKERVHALLALAKKAFSINYEQSEIYTNRALIEAKKIKDTLLLGEALFAKIRIQWKKGEYSSAIKYGNKAIHLLESTNSEILAKTYNIVGLTYLKTGDFEQALYYLFKSLAVIEDNNIDIQDLKAGILLNISVIHYRCKNYEDSLTHIEQAQSIFKTLGIKKGLFQCYISSGNVYILLNEVDKAFEYYNKALFIVKDLGDQYQMSVVYNNLAIVSEQRGDFETALNFVKKSLEIKNKLNNKHSIVVGYDRLSFIYSSMGEFDEALKHLNKALVLAEEIGAKPHIARIFKKYAEIYAKIGDFKLAYEFQIRYTEQNEKLYDDEKARSMEEMRSRYQLEQKEQEAKILKQKEAEITRYAKQLEESNEDLRQFAHIVSHDLKEPLRMVKSYVTLIKRFLDKDSFAKIEEFYDFAVDGATRMQQLITDILSLASIQKEGRKFGPTTMNDVMFIVGRNLGQLVQEKKGEVIYNNLPNIHADESQIVQLFQNLIGNGLKYNQSERPIVTIDCKQQNDHYIFSIKDNGIGIPEKFYKKIFEMFQRLHTKADYKGTGIGLAICKKIVDRHNGEIWVNAEKGEGSTFYFKIAMPSTLGNLSSDS